MSKGAGGSCPAWEWESCSIFAFTEECVILAKNDWKHIPLKSSFCFMRCIAAGARSMMLWFLYACRYRRHWIIDSISKTPQEQVQHFRWRQRKRGWEVKKVGAERSMWSSVGGWREGGGLLISLVKAAGKQHGNQLVVGFLSVLQLWASPFISSPLTALAGRPEVKVTQGRRLQTRHRTCVPLCPPGLHP